MVTGWSQLSQRSLNDSMIPTGDLSLTEGLLKKCLGWLGGKQESHRTGATGAIITQPLTHNRKRVRDGSGFVLGATSTKSHTFKTHFCSKW